MRRMPSRSSADSCGHQENYEDGKYGSRTEAEKQVQEAGRTRGVLNVGVF